MSKALVITPTYNESENVRHLIDEVLKQDLSLEILIVDDNSPDGTANIVKEIQKSNSRVHILERPRKMGLGTAYVAGFKYAIANGFDFMIEMDADFSHNPNELPTFLKLMNENDLVYRLLKRAEIRRQIPTRKSVQNNEADRIADLLEEAATEIERLRDIEWMYKDLE